MYIMCEFMTKRLPNGFEIPIAVVGIGSKAELYHFALIAVEAEGARLVGGMLGGVHLRENGDGEFMCGHGGANAGVVAEAGEETEGFFGVGEIV